MSTTSVPGPAPRWADEDRARALRAAPLPEQVLRADEAALLELALLGVPTAGAALAGLLERAAHAASTGPAALRDEEGVLRAVVEGGALLGVDPPAHADALDLRPPADVRALADLADPAHAVALLVPAVLDPAALALARGVAAERGSRLLVVLAPDALGPDAAAAAVRAARALLSGASDALLAGSSDGVRVVRLPAPPTRAPADVLPHLVGAAALLGAVDVVVPGGGGAAVAVAADAVGVVVRDAPETDVLAALARGETPVDLPAEALAALRVVAPPPSARGFCVFFTGLSGSGKSTVAQALVAQLREVGGRRVTVLDGDVVRHHLSRGLTFSREDRDTNVERIGFVASVVAAHGGAAVCAPIAPFDVTRRRVRAMVEAEGAFVLVHVATPLEVCEARDRKGLYAKARAGEIPSFTGVSDPYEAPADAEVVVDTSRLSAVDAAQQVLAHLRDRGLVT